jgi:hypothetical protein
MIRPRRIRTGSVVAEGAVTYASLHDRVCTVGGRFYVGGAWSAALPMTSAAGPAGGLGGSGVTLAWSRIIGHTSVNMLQPCARSLRHWPQSVPCVRRVERRAPSTSSRRGQPPMTPPALCTTAQRRSTRCAPRVAYVMRRPVAASALTAMVCWRACVRACGGCGYQRSWCCCDCAENSNCDTRRILSQPNDNEPALTIRQESQTYLGNMVELVATRAASSAFNFIVADAAGVNVRYWSPRAVTAAAVAPACAHVVRIASVSLRVSRCLPFEATASCLRDR